MSKKSASALRRLEAHNESPKNPESGSRQSRRESCSRDRSSRGSSRHNSNENEEERMPNWAKQLLDAQKESDQRLHTLETRSKRRVNKQGRNESTHPCQNSSSKGTKYNTT